MTSVSHLAGAFSDLWLCLREEQVLGTCLYKNAGMDVERLGASEQKASQPQALQGGRWGGGGRDLLARIGELKG